MHPDARFGWATSTCTCRAWSGPSASNRNALGLELVLRFGAGALFFAAGGYHHVGANILAGRDASPPPSNAVRLLHFAFVVPSARDVAALARRLEQAGAKLGPLAQLGAEVLEGAELRGKSTEGFATHNEDGLTVAVVSRPRP